MYVCMYVLLFLFFFFVPDRAAKKMIKKICDNNKVPRIFVFKVLHKFHLFIVLLFAIKHSAPLFLDFVGPFDAIVHPFGHRQTHQDCKQQSTQPREFSTTPDTTTPV